MTSPACLFMKSLSLMTAHLFVVSVSHLLNTGADPGVDRRGAQSFFQTIIHTAASLKSKTSNDAF